jgi:hypothetical protein
MNSNFPRLNVQQCPNCGAALNPNTLTCRDCGGILAIEGFMSRLKSESSSFFRRAPGALGKGRLVLWTLALTPLLLAPPLVAIFLVGRQSKIAEIRADQWLGIVIVAVCNIVLSILFWRWLAELSFGFGTWIGLFLRSFGMKQSGGLQSI